MKLQNLSVIFLVIAIPVILLLSYYISLQIDTINMQTAYDQKLRESTKDAIGAFEINTVEWNEAYSELGDSKRRDINASINTFINSLANNIGVSGTSKEYLIEHIPAIAYTLYDGYYIYSPSEVKKTITDHKEVVVAIRRELIDEDITDGVASDKPIVLNAGYDTYNDADAGKILYALPEGVAGIGQYYVFDEEGNPVVDDDTGNQLIRNFTLEAEQADTEYKHILKPFTSYSQRYVDGDIDIVVNYTLDNYITIYGKTTNIAGDYQTRSGYLVNTEVGGVEIAVPTSSATLADGTTLNVTKVNGSDITIKEQPINAEELSEKIAYKGENNVYIYNYVYEAENNTKVYFDAGGPFQVSSTGEKTYLSTIGSVKYKKATIMTKDPTTSEIGYIELYQALNDNTNLEINAGEWYTKRNDKDTKVPTPSQFGLDNDLEKDYSAINYCVESYIFSEWVYDNLNTIQVDGKQIFDKIKPPYDATKDANDPNRYTPFEIHKINVIKQSIITNLNQAITSYARNDPDGRSI